MIRLLDITLKDLLQLGRDRKTFLFLLIMPVAFTLLIGFASGGFSRGTADPRLPVGFLDQDGTRLSGLIREQLGTSDVIRLESIFFSTPAFLESQVANEKLSAAILIPAGYSHAVLDGKSARLVLIGDTGTPAGMTVKSEALSAANRIQSAARTALILERLAGDSAPFDYVLEQTLSAWEDPPIRVVETTSSAIQRNPPGLQAFAHTSPGMMLQFAIAGLLTSAQIIVSERKSRALQRLLTTAVSRLHILFGHFLAILTLISIQFLLLIAFGNFILKVNYLRAPLATLVVAFGSALCISALGLLIGMLAKTEEQAVIFSLVPMFLLAGLGGAWVPLEVTSQVFRSIGHLSPIAWAMDGFKNISIRGLGLPSALLPFAALSGYALIFFLLAAWRLYRTEER